MTGELFLTVFTLEVYLKARCFTAKLENTGSLRLMQLLFGQVRTRSMRSVAQGRSWHQFIVINAVDGGVRDKKRQLIDLIFREIGVLDLNQIFAAISPTADSGRW